MVDVVHSPAGREVHLPSFTGDLVGDGEGACPLGCQLACAHLEGQMIRHQPHSLSDVQSRLLAAAVRLELHPGRGLGEGLCDL